jgi:hypothetical protein
MENKKHILNSFTPENISNIFKGKLTLSIIYFFLLTILIICIYSTSYITIGILFILHFILLFLYQIYRSKGDYLQITISAFVTIIMIVITLLFPDNTTIIENIQNPIMDGSVMGIIYSTIIYSILFMLSITYVNYNDDNNKYILLGFSILCIILFILYIIIRNKIPASITNYQTDSTLSQILIITPFISSIMYLLYFLIDNTKLNSFEENISTSSFNNLILNPEYVNKNKEKNITISKEKNITIYKEFYTQVLVLAYGFIITVCFIIFLYSASKYTNLCSYKEYLTYIINGVIIITIIGLSVKMTISGIDSEDSSLFKGGSIKMDEVISSLSLSEDQLMVIIFLVMYNIFLSKIFNDSCLQSILDKIQSYFNLKPILDQICFKVLSDNIPIPFISSSSSKVYCVTDFEFNPLSNEVWYSIIGGIIYIITFALYYIIITKDIKTTNNSNLLMFFIVFILFISILLFINNSKVIKESYFNNVLTSYIYAIIVYSFLFCIGTIIIYFMSYDDKINITFKHALTYSLFILFGIFFLFSLISWFIKLFSSFSITNSDGSTSVISIILNIAIIITIMAILFKMISYSSYYKDSPLLQVIIGSVFYIPCLFISLINYITGYYKENKNSIPSTPSINLTDVILLLIIIILYLLYFYLPSIYTIFSSQGGTILIKEPIYLNNEKVLMSYPTVIISDKSIHSYSYGLSCWIFIDGGSSINNANNKYCSILNYGNKPNLQYKGKNNTFIITYDNNDKDIIDNKFKLDEFGNVIIYETTELLLQKWNNIIFNYSSGIMDIFINGELKQSYEGIIPYMKHDTISSGQNDGIHGGICNVVYYNKELTMEKISNIYNSVKLLNPPILLNYYDSLYLSSLKVENITEKIGLNQIKE